VIHQNKELAKVGLMKPFSSQLKLQSLHHDSLILILIAFYWQKSVMQISTNDNKMDC
jgi:hypothetical protein